MPWSWIAPRWVRISVPSSGIGWWTGVQATLTAGAPLLRSLVLDMLASPEIASRRIVWRQYDHQVGTNTVVPPGSDAAVVRIKGTKKALAISTDGNAAYTYLDPYTGGAIAVAEAAERCAASE